MTVAANIIMLHPASAILLEDDMVRLTRSNRNLEPCSINLLPPDEIVNTGFDVNSGDLMNSMSYPMKFEEDSHSTFPRT